MAIMHPQPTPEVRQELATTLGLISARAAVMAMHLRDGRLSMEALAACLDGISALADDARACVGLRKTERQS